MGQEPAGRGRAGQRLRGCRPGGGQHPWRVHAVPEGSQRSWLGASEGRGRTPASRQGDPAGVELATWPFCAPFPWSCLGGGNSERGPRGQEPDEAPPALHPACPPGKGSIRGAWYRGPSPLHGLLDWAPGQQGRRPHLVQLPEGETSRSRESSGSKSLACGRLASMARFARGAWFCTDPEPKQWGGGLVPECGPERSRACLGPHGS